MQEETCALCGSGYFQTASESDVVEACLRTHSSLSKLHLRESLSMALVTCEEAFASTTSSLSAEAHW